MMENPKENSLPREVLEGYLREAVAMSGYPLQGVVADQLQAEFSVAEEWSYLDRVTAEQRTLDIFAFRRLSEETRSGLLVAPSLLLLIECKRSRHPYVFFKSKTENGRRLAGFPKIAGLPRVELHQNLSSREVLPSECIGLETESFSIDGPPICTSLARAGAKGAQRRPDQSKTESHESTVKNVELTGSDAYNGIIMPLISSLEFLTDYYKPSSSPIFPVIAIAVCVLDAPMVLSPEGWPEEPVLSMTPWVRLLRREQNSTRRIPTQPAHRRFRSSVCSFRFY